jgi:exonuclease VII small subunit
MTLPELAQPLNRLAFSEVQEQEVRALFKRVLTTYLDRSTCHSLILDLQAQLDADRHSRRAPYYYIILALMHYHSADLENALLMAELSAHHFNSQGRDLQYAFSRWFRGMLYYKQGDLPSAKGQIEEAVEVLTALEKEDKRQGMYDRKYQDHLEAIRGSDSAMLGALTVRGGRVPVRDLAEAFEFFKPPRSAKLIEDLRCAVHQLKLDDEEQLHATASDLSFMLNELKREKRPPEPFLDAFLAHCRALLAHIRDEQHALALQHNWSAVRGFESGNDLRNQAVAHWMRGLLHLSRGDEISCHIHLEKARALLEELLEKNAANGDAEKNPEIEDLIGRITARLPHVPSVQSEQAPAHNLANRLLMTWRKRRSSAIPRSARGPAFHRTRSARKTSVPPASPPRVIIPSTPYYGHVAAGPNGEPVLPNPSELAWVDAVDESHSFTFEGKAYHVTFVHNDRIWLPPSDGQEYGWLKVHGHSMDKAEPIPMQPGDLVLFRVACDLEDCVGQIVVAVLPDETQVPQLVVKRLERTAPSSTDKPVAFGLFSESTYKQDPKTGVSYHNPIPITRDDQVRGQVVAVATRNQDGAHWVGGD